MWEMFMETWPGNLTVIISMGVYLGFLVFLIGDEWQ